MLFGLMFFELLGAFQPVDGGVAAAGADIGLADLRMRVGLPRLLENGGGLAQLVLAEQRLGGDDRRGLEIGREFQRMDGVVAGAGRIVSSFSVALASAARRASGRPPPFRSRVRLLLFEQADRIIPATGLAAGFERRLGGPGEIGRVVGGLFGILPGGLVGAEALGFEIEAAQA
jgi:hypothetical protein